MQNDFHESVRKGCINKLELYLQVLRYQTETNKIFLKSDLWSLKGHFQQDY